MVSDIRNWCVLWLRIRLNPCSNGIWSLTVVVNHNSDGTWCLNPCSNGIWSLTVVRTVGGRRRRGLNPCSNGIWSLTGGWFVWSFLACVLILVLMEYGLWHNLSGYINNVTTVLILVLMEYGLWQDGVWPHQYPSGGLNPCSNGIWSLTRCVRTCSLYVLTVLILVLMEYGLWPGHGKHTRGTPSVLILVLMEYGLWHVDKFGDKVSTNGLNPCSNGIWSLTRNCPRVWLQGTDVLILVLMEYGLWQGFVFDSALVTES